MLLIDSKVVSEVTVTNGVLAVFIVWGDEGNESPAGESKLNPLLIIQQ
ncbi:MAG: hypothetical protein WBG74_14875 [Shewanella sp.]